MPRPTKPARLYLEPARKDAGGRITHEATWVATYRDRRRRTGCREDDVEGAQRQLAAFVGEIEARARAEAEPELNKPAGAVACADVLATYAERKAATVARPKELLSRIESLLDFWGDKTLAQVTERNCIAYAKSRSTPAAARRELDDFKAAVTMATESGLLREIVLFTMPEKNEARADWMTREQVAALVRYCYRYREVQTVNRGPRKGEKVVTKKRALLHLVPFILTAVYTASRSQRIWRASFVKVVGRPYIDLETGVFYRRWQGERVTKKRAGTIRLPERLIAYMRRWHAGPLVNGVRVPRNNLVEWRGKEGDTKKALSRAMKKVFGPDHPFVRHSFRHTSVTWLMIAGEDLDDICLYASMTKPVLIEVYGHFHPDSHASVGKAFSSGRAGKRPRKMLPKQPPGPIVPDEEDDDD